MNPIGYLGGGLPLLSIDLSNQAKVTVMQSAAKHLARFVKRLIYCHTRDASLRSALRTFTRLLSNDYLVERCKESRLGIEVLGFFQPAHSVGLKTLKKNLIIRAIAFLD
jgi:hypothetical protein